ncbi:MAG: hypothetical protein R2828_05375 [Saprospiraceae bacterium]
MGFFDRFFNTSHQPDDDAQPDIRFGRYSDSYKQKENYQAWDVALDLFDKGDYLGSYKSFFQYLRDEKEDNVKYWEANGSIHFELYQGSKKISGTADATKLTAEAKVAKTAALNVGFMRRLMEQNFDLKYGRFALDREQNITMLFDTYTLDGSPYKLYYALKEVATRADKHDDLLLDEFKMLQPVDVSHLRTIPDEEKEIKYNFITRQIKTVINEIEHGQLDRDQYPGGIAYLLLQLVYKLDYLIKPEGYMMETLERIHRTYFAKDDKSTAQKNLILAKELKKLMDRPKADFFKEMYRVTATFGITLPVSHDRIVSVIDNEIPSMDWYLDNGYEAIALAFPNYIVSYCMFSYAVPKPDRDLFHLYFRIIQNDFFSALGYTNNYYDAETGKLNRRAIIKAIDHIVEENKEEYYRCNPNVSALNFTSLPLFAKSYLHMIRNLDLTKIS